MNLHKIGQTAHEINAANGWKVFTPEDWPNDGELDKVYFLGAHATLIHEEISEAFRGVRNRNRDNFDEELADAIIRITSIAYGLGTDLEAAIIAKMAKNWTRGLHHGGKAV